VYDPQVGGMKIPDAIKPRIRQRILAHAQKHYAGRYNQIEVWFRDKFCYIDAYPNRLSPRSTTRNSMGGNYERNVKKYEPCFFDNGTWHGTPEEAFDASAVYLME